MEVTNYHIHEWQQTISSSQEEAIEKPLVALLFDASSELFLHLLDDLSRLKIKKDTLRRFERSYHQFLLWDNGYGVSKGSLEEKLKRSQRMGDFTIRTLKSICRTLTMKIVPIIEEDEGTNKARYLEAANVWILAEKLSVLLQSDDSNDGFSTEDDSSDNEAMQPPNPDAIIAAEKEKRARKLSLIASDLQADMECLLDLASRFEEQVINPVISEDAADPRTVEGWDPAERFVKQIQSRFPLCDPALSSRLGKAVWERVLKHHKRRNQLNHEDVQTAGDETLIDPEKIPSGNSKSSQYRDSGIGTSTYTKSVYGSGKYAPLLITLPGSKSSWLGFPTLEDLAPHGNDFTCIACGKRLWITEEMTWRHHILSDIEPYVCLECPSEFECQETWIEHLEIEHKPSSYWQDFTCQLCHENVKTGRGNVVNHLSRHLAEIFMLSLMTYPRGISKYQSKNAPTNSSTPPLNRHVCAQHGCFREFSSPEALKQHIRATHNLEQTSDQAVQHEEAEIRPSSPKKAERKALTFTQPRSKTPDVDLRSGADTRPASPSHDLPSALAPATARASKPEILQKEDDPSSSLILDAALKRARNTLAARKSRERKAQQLEEAEERIKKLEEELAHWKKVAHLRSNLTDETSQDREKEEE
ncbi:hypothetical protein B0I35DRAFT_161193 [Stachybotrys elegans]|uniref:C2H2-type domain-containing protein n=1 Tax=Stachybotrys elegans TaxID=80388 RepID=A0A8K0WVF4_9HYPO|nr:hypothetical protein B0I35DRAFT_161193 [Stachybotrys elegans]